MKRIRNFLFEKKDGHVHVAVMVALLMLMIATFAVLGLGYRKVSFIKYKMDNGVILSALSADVVDIYSLATFDDIVFDAGTNGAYNNRTDEVSLKNACAQSLSLAYGRFSSSVCINLPITQVGTTFVPKNGSEIENVTLNSFVIYNVIQNDVYVCEKGGGIEKKANAKGTLVCEETGDLVNNSALYVSMNFNVYAMGKYYTIPINEYVDIVEK